MVTDWQHPLVDAGLPLMASPPKLGLTPVRTALPPPLLGQPTEAVLRELLQYDDQQPATLKNEKVT